MTGQLWRIVAPHFVAGLIVRDGFVVEAAPIIGWADGRPWPYLKTYMQRKGWHGEPL